MIADDLPAYLRQAVDQQLAPNERLLRLEQPDPARFRRGLAWGTVAIGLLFVLFTAITLHAGTWSFATLYALFAAAFLSGPLQIRRAARNLVYAITSERVVVVRRSIGGKLEARSIDGDMLKPRVRPHGRGIGGDIELMEGYGGGDWLIGLRDVRAAEVTLRCLIQSSSKSSL